MTATLTQIFRILKDIRDELSRPQLVSAGRGQTSVNLSGLRSVMDNVLSELQTHATTLSSILTKNTEIEVDTTLTAARLTTINTNTILIEDHLGDINSATADSELTLDAIAALLVTIDADTNEIGNNTDGLEGTQADIKSKLDAVNSELDSIDANWNIGSVNNIALLATATQTLGNSTEDKQDDVITKLGQIDSVLDDQESSLNTIITHVDGIEGKLDTMIAHLDNIEDVQPLANGGITAELAMTNGDLTKQEAIASGNVHKIQSIKITGEATSARTIQFNVVLAGISFPLINIAVASGSVVVSFEDSKWDQMRQTILDMLWTSNIEIQSVASGVTATEQITVVIGSERINS